MRQEYRHHTDEQVHEIVEKAAALVEDLAISDDLRPVAFGKACDLYCAKQIVMEQVQPSLPMMAIPQGRH